MIRIVKFVFNPFQENTYLLTDQNSGDTLLVDPGCYENHEFQAVENFIKQKNLNLKGQINTHCHIDHILGVPYFRDKHGLSFTAHEDEEILVGNAHLTAGLFGLNAEPFPPIDEYILPGKKIEVGNIVLDAIHVPGHSMGSIALYSEISGFVLSGDVLFQGSIGRTDLPGGDYDTLINSIRSGLLVLPRETVVYPGHGPSTTIEDEIRTNPFLQMR